MREPIRITVNVNQKANLQRIAVVVGLQIVVIGLGAAIGSVAMQWCGFMLLVLFLFAYIASASKETSGITIQAARDYLDKLEAPEARK